MAKRRYRKRGSTAGPRAALVEFLERRGLDGATGLPEVGGSARRDPDPGLLERWRRARGQLCQSRPRRRGVPAAGGARPSRTERMAAPAATSPPSRMAWSRRRRRPVTAWCCCYPTTNGYSAAAGRSTRAARSVFQLSAGQRGTLSRTWVAGAAILVMRLLAPRVPGVRASATRAMPQAAPSGRGAQGRRFARHSPVWQVAGLRTERGRAARSEAP